MSDTNPSLIDVSHKGLHVFASSLTTKVRELDQMERDYRILPSQSTEILTQMIESFVYAASNGIANQIAVRKGYIPEQKELTAQEEAILFNNTKDLL